MAAIIVSASMCYPILHYDQPVTVMNKECCMTYLSFIVLVVLFTKSESEPSALPENDIILILI